MGLFSKIFGSENGEGERPGEGAELVSETRTSDGSKNPPGKQGNSVSANKPPEKTEVDGSSNDSNSKRRSPNSVGRGAPVSVRADTVRGGTRAPASPPQGAADATPSPTSRPSVPAKVEARLHGSPTFNVGGSSQKKAPAPKARAEEPREPPPAPKGTQPRGEAARPSPVVSVGAAPPLSKTLQLDTRPAGAPALKRDPSAGSRAPADPISPVWSKRVEASELVLEPFTAPAPVPAVAPAVPVAAPSHRDTDDVDAAFDRIADSPPAPGSNRGRLADNGVAKEENQRLFRQMIVGHARPIREFVIELSVGPTTSQWLEIVRPAARSLVDAATALDETDLVAALTDFTRALDAASLSFKPKIAGADREMLLVDYQKLSRALPAAFDVRADRDRREPIVVHHLLLLAPGVHKVAIDKLYAAGLGSLDALCRSSVDDLVALGRLEPETAQAVARRFQDYWRARTEQAPEKGDERARSRLRALVDELGRAHEEFERAESDDDKEKKRRARSDRRTKMLELNVLLAELGEVDLVQELERTATLHRIERVKEFVERRSDHAA